ncbi:MAG TPA: class I SAM-dependent methyltransferase [Rhodanobacteraceae bacterium]|nr:class I SAM-dependent methyltransferase [Rhodanobacteraceae bacterium]
MNPFSRISAGLKLLRLREFAVKAFRCPFCGPSLFVRLCNEPIGIRCVRCGASAVHLALGWGLVDYAPPLETSDACELSARGPLVAYLRRKAKSVALSEYFADAEPGSMRNGVRCEDVQRLSYADASFDLVTHTEVLEHVPDDTRAFAELFRVLRPGGTMIFTVPLHRGYDTIERARLVDGRVEHLLEPVYHLDPLRREGILAFRDYGWSLVERLTGFGFVDARQVLLHDRVPWTWDSPVIMARKPVRST